jgi:hypothetical protein
MWFFEGKNCTRTAKAKGSRLNVAASAFFESCGYMCTKAGGSLGLFDVIAIGPGDIRCIQVKANEYLSAIEREQIRSLPVPTNVSRECWQFIDGNRTRR